MPSKHKFTPFLYLLLLLATAYAAAIAQEPATGAETAAENKPVFGGQTTTEPDTANTAQTPPLDIPVDTDSPKPVFKSPSTRIKNVAVVETEIDAQSGASAELTSADARLVTAELRREAVKNLPKGKYNVMTSETVYAQGSAVLEECADENCVIVLGSAIGADFIVRGIISKVQTRFTLSVEIYETDNGNLVASSEPIRSESLGDLLEQSAAVCAEMYKTFVNAYTPPPEPAAPPPPPVVIQEPDTPLWKLHKIGIDISVGAGGLIMAGYGGGVAWPNGERIKMPYSATGAYLYLDAVYAEVFVGYTAGDGTWDSPDAVDPQNLPSIPRAYINAGLLAKYPITCYERVKLFPLLGLDYEMSISGKIRYADGNEYLFDGANNRPNANSLSSLWLKIGAGIDFDLGKIIYLRSELIYGLRAANAFEQFCADKLQSGTWAEFGQGVSFKIGVGAKL